jgi:tetratricopeptide (TPR) repeat protein
MPLTDFALMVNPICKPAKQLAWILSFALFCWPGITYAVSYNQDAPKTFALFKPISQTAADKRVAVATDIYKSNCRHLAEPMAMAVLDSLSTLAQSLSDNSLEGSIFLMRADYYSVNRGFNTQSISYHQQAIDFAVTHEMPVETAQYLHKKGLYYFTFNHNPEACRYFLQAYDKFKEIGFKHVPDISRYLAEQAQFYYALKDYETAEPLLKQALSFPINGERIRINLTTTIGLIHRNFRQFPQALNYFNRALKLATAGKDSAWIAISMGNIGSVYFMQGQYDKAIPDLELDYKASIKYEQFGNAATTLLRLSHINIQNNQLKIAAARIDSAEALLAKTKDDVLSNYIEIYRQMAIITQKDGQLADAIAYSKHYETARDSFARRDNIVAVEGVKLKWENEKYKTQLEQLNTRSSIRVLNVMRLSVSCFC